MRLYNYRRDGREHTHHFSVVDFERNTGVRVLRECPFCGGRTDNLILDGYRDVCIKCTQCGCEGPTVIREQHEDFREVGFEAIKQWDNRGLRNNPMLTFMELPR